MKKVTSDNSGSNDLFNVHDFDITIDLDVPGSKYNSPFIKRSDLEVINQVLSHCRLVLLEVETNSHKGIVLL